MDSTTIDSSLGALSLEGANSITTPPLHSDMGVDMSDEVASLQGTPIGAALLQHFKKYGDVLVRVGDI